MLDLAVEHIKGLQSELQVRVRCQLTFSRILHCLLTAEIYTGSYNVRSVIQLQLAV
jgi:hypothetical protein